MKGILFYIIYILYLQIPEMNNQTEASSDLVCSDFIFLYLLSQFKFDW